jgi:hypothetical protein
MAVPMSVTLTVKVTATCDYCTWTREFEGFTATIEAAGVATGHALTAHNHHLTN